MNKLNVLFVALTLVAASCSSENVGIADDVQVESVDAPVTVRVNNFSITQEDISEVRTRETKPVKDYSGIKALTLAFYSGNTEVYKTTQLKENSSTYTTFGSFDLSLPLGSYTMVVLGYGLFDDDEFTLASLTEAAYTIGCPRETFATTQTVNITNTSAVSLSATLSRIVTRLQVCSTDGKTANVNKVRMTFSAGNKSFNPVTGLATANAGSVSIVGTSTKVGETSSSIGYVYLYTDEQTMDVTIETLDSEGNTIYTKTVNDVPFKRNRLTKLTGPLYGANASSAFQVNTTWLTEHEMSF